MSNKGNIGFLFYGNGGISLLSKSIRKMTYEKFICVKDSFFLSKNEKSKSGLVYSCLRMCNFLMKKDVKAIIVSCDEATMIAIDELKTRFDVPIIGVYPSFFSLMRSRDVEKIIVMGVEETFYSRKFNEILKINPDNKKVYKLACPEIVSLLKKGVFEGTDIEALITEYFKGFNLDEKTAVVLGSGYYSLIDKTIVNVLGEDIKIVDSVDMATNRLHEKLCNLDLINSCGKSECELYNINNEEKVEFVNCLKDYQINTELEGRIKSLFVRGNAFS